MECREVRQLAEAFVSEQLLVETTQAVVAHMERCPECRAEIDGLRRLRTATRSAFERMPDLRVRPEFATELRSRLVAEAARPSATVMTRRGWLALAASLVAGVALLRREWAQSRAPELANIAVGDHRFCALTFQLTEAPVHLAEAARRFGSVYGAFETVEPSTTALSGGTLRILERHACVYEGQRFVHMVLGYNDQKVSLLVTGEARSTVGRAIDPTFTALPEADGFHVASLGGSDHAVFLVPSLNDHDVQEVARAMIGPVMRALSVA